MEKETIRREIPVVIKEGFNKVLETSLATEFFSNRTVFLTGPITSEYADIFVPQLLLLAWQSNDPINIFINSGGGEINAGLYMYDVIQSLNVPVNMYCTGRSASMAAVLLASGQPGRRFILPHSEVMIHEPLINSGVGGSTTTIRNLSESLLKARDVLNGILSKHTGKSLEEIEAATAYDHFMDAAEAVDFGICDQIVDSLF